MEYQQHYKYLVIQHSLVVFNPFNYFEPGMPIQSNPIDKKFDIRYREFGNRSHDLEIQSNR